MTDYTGYVPASLPAGFGELPPGGGLAGALAGVPVGEVSGFDAVTLAEAAYRQATHSRAVFLRAMAESGMRVPGSAESVEHVEHPSEFSPDEVRAALVWSRTRADSTFWFAHSVFVRLPMLGEAMLAGELDEPRAKAFVDWTAGLSDEHTTRVCDELMPAAPSLLVGQLVDRIKRLAIALDPEWAQRRYDEAVKTRRVESWQGPDGTANVAGRDLPADRAQAGTDRINTLARAAKSAGDGRAADAIRADLFLGMLDGQFVGMTDQQIVQHLLAHPIADGDRVDASAEQDDAAGEDTAAGGETAVGETAAGDHAAWDDADRNDAAGGGSTAWDDAARDDPAWDDVAWDDVAEGEAAGSQDGKAPGRASRVPTGEEFAPAPERAAWNASELRVELGTLLGLDRHPAELPGLGYVPAGVAIGMLPRLLRGEWRFVVCDTGGVPICSGITPARPRLDHSGGVAADPRGRGIVELQLTTVQLARWRSEVALGQHAAWSAVIVDVGERVDAGALDDASSNGGRRDGSDQSVDGAAGRNSGDADAVAAYDADGGSADGRDAGSNDAQAGVRRRVARAGLRRWIEVRDRYCLHPACRLPATRTDQDHRTDYAAGGSTTAGNLDSMCRHDHRLIHEAGWTTRRGDAGEIIWTSGLGHTYVTRTPPVMMIYPDPEPGIADPE